MNKKIIWILIIAIAVCSISFASAADDSVCDNLTDIETESLETSIDEEVFLEDNDLENNLAEDENEVTAANNEYRQIQDMIDQAGENETVTLNGATYDCDYLIFVNKTITIDGNGSTLKFNGTDKDYTSPFFYINYTASNVVLKNLKFIGGICFFGGAVSWHGDNGLILNCTFMDNSAQGRNAIGGAILVLGNYCNITDCTFKNNMAHKYGGAVLINGTGAVISNCEFTGNFENGMMDNETEDDLMGGGALLLISDDNIVKNCTFENNSASEAGGAISVLMNRNNTIINCKFEGNSISGIQGGGAVYSASFGMTIDNCSFVGNNAIAINSTGGAISLSIDDIVKNSFFKNNFAYKEQTGIELGNDIAYLGDVTQYKNNIFSNTFILDYLEAEYYAVGVSHEEIFNQIHNNNNFIKTKLNSTIAFYPLSGIIFEYGATSNSITIRAEGGNIQNGNIIVLNHPEANINYNNGVLSISGLNVGSYVLRVTTTPDEWHNPVSADLGITVNKATAVITAEKQTFAYKKSSLWSIKLVDSRNKKPIANMKLTLNVYTGSKCKTVNVYTNSKGIATYQTKALAAGNHKVIVSATHGQYKFNTVTSSIKVVKQTALKFKVKKATKKTGATLSITVKNKKTKKAINGVKIKIMIYNGKKLVKTVILKTMKKGKYKGVCGYATNKLTVGTHKVKIVPFDIKYSGSASSKMKITKKHKKQPAWESKDTAK